ncbi:transglycosylase SLT domain-containing protein [Roseibium salinum]|nr:transglycosylase SLT domain-containing protein [Roseibium salinum]
MQVADTTSIASRIELAFQSASSSTGTSFDYLVKTAARESAFNPTAKARTSSATGLFQFIESTWLETMKEAGPRHGLEKNTPTRSSGPKKRQILRKRSPDAPRNTRPA